MYNMNGEFVWWTGVVEDIKDPELMGRARVRIVGYHTPDLAILPTVQLPWAHPIFPVTSASTQGKGMTVPGFLPGTHVFGFFLDGSEAQQPVIMGTIPGINLAPNKPAEGFNDPYDAVRNDLYDQKPDTNLLASAPPQDGTPGSKKEPKSDIETASGDTWNEPYSEAFPQYPQNKVYESNSGHIIEVDDSSGAERIHVYHRKGSFIEIYPNGTVHVKAVGHAPESAGPDGAGNDFNPDFVDTTGMFVVIEPNAQVYIGGNLDLTMDGNCNIKAKNFIFKGEKCSFDLSDSFVVNAKSFGANASEDVSMLGGTTAKVGAPDEVALIQGEGKIKMANGNIDLN